MIWKTPPALTRYASIFLALLVFLFCGNAASGSDYGSRVIFTQRHSFSLKVQVTLGEGGVALASKLKTGTSIASASARMTGAAAKAEVAVAEEAGIAANAGKTSPSLTHPELAGKSADEIRALAGEKGFDPHATKPDKWMDPVTSKERLRLDPGHIDKKTGVPYNDPKAAAPHHHGYEPDGKTKIVDPTDQNPHIPTKP